MRNPTQSQYRFSCRRPRSKQELWGVGIPNLANNWSSMCRDDTLVPGWQICTVLRSSPLPSLSFVSAKGLNGSAPNSLKLDLSTPNPDRTTWMESYREEKIGINNQDVYDIISREKYRDLRREGIPRATPFMCVHNVKRDLAFAPHRAKSRIVVLGNHEDRQWTKPQRHATLFS